jgi:hypothetical protein
MHVGAIGGSLFQLYTYTQPLTDMGHTKLLVSLTLNSLFQ